LYFCVIHFILLLTFLRVVFGLWVDLFAVFKVKEFE
jgi:hypothetical protein